MLGHHTLTEYFVYNNIKRGVLGPHNMLLLAYQYIFPLIT